MSKGKSPWVEQFSGIESVDAIRAKTVLRVHALEGLAKVSAEEAADRIKDAWEATFYPTARSCEIMQEVVGSAASHAARHHPNIKTHLANCYAEKIDIEPYMPILLTGPAGTGKSQLRAALGRLFPEPAKVKLDDGHDEFPLVASRSITVRGRSSVASILTLLDSPNDIGRQKVRNLPNLYDSCAHWQYLCGVCCIFLDELQFLTQSSTANTLITQALLGLSYVRTPYLVVANYSLVHRLKRRNSEDLQRLLGRPIVLLPDGPNSKDWGEVLREYQLVVPGVYGFDFVECASPLWSYTAGLKRSLVKLLTFAYKKSRRAKRDQVTWLDVENAYLSLEYSTQRGEVEMMLLHGASSSALPDDLRCPFPVDTPDSLQFSTELADARAAKVAAAALHTSSTLAEQKAAEFVKQLLNGADPTATKQSKERPKSPRTKSTAASLKEAGERFRKRS